MEGNTRTIVLLGKTGSGKSSLANTLFGEKDTFKVSCSANSGTNSCLSKTKTINGRSVQLIDTPGFFDTDLNSEELKSELLKCIVECAPGPHKESSSNNLHQTSQKKSFTKRPKRKSTVSLGEPYWGFSWCSRCSRRSGFSTCSCTNSSSRGTGSSNRRGSGRGRWSKGI